MRITPGSYLGTVRSSALAPNPKDGGYLAVLIELDMPDGSTVSLTWYGYCSEAAWPQTEKGLIAMGWVPAENDYRLDFLNVREKSPLAGKKVSCKVQDKQNLQGETHSEIRFVNPIGGVLAIKEQMPEADARAWAAQLRGRLIAQGGAPRQPRAAAPAVTQQMRDAAKQEVFEGEFDDFPS